MFRRRNIQQIPLKAVIIDRIVWRGGSASAMDRNSSARDVLDYEIEELGNNQTIVEHPTLDLTRVPAIKTEWVTFKREHAAYYGRPYSTKQRFVILARDSFDPVGYYILRGATDTFVAELFENTVSGNVTYSAKTPLEAFYARLDECFPGDVLVPIPALSQVRAISDAQEEAFALADFAFRKIVPRLYDRAGLTEKENALRGMSPIKSESTAFNSAFHAAIEIADGFNPADDSHEDYEDYEDEDYEDEDYEDEDYEDADDSPALGRTPEEIAMLRSSSVAREAENAARRAAANAAYAVSAAPEAKAAYLAAVGYAVADVVAAAAAVEPDATWVAVNKMLRAAAQVDPEVLPNGGRRIR